MCGTVCISSVASLLHSEDYVRRPSQPARAQHRNLITPTPGSTMRRERELMRASSIRSSSLSADLQMHILTSMPFGLVVSITSEGEYTFHGGHQGLYSDEWTHWSNSCLQPLPSIYRSQCVPRLSVTVALFSNVFHNDNALLQPSWQWRLHQPKL